MVLERTRAHLHGLAGPVSHMLIETREHIEHGALANIGLPCQCDRQAAGARRASEL